MITKIKNWFKGIESEPIKIKSFALKGDIFDKASSYFDDPNWDTSVKVRRQFWRIVKKHHPETEGYSCHALTQGAEIYILCFDNEVDIYDVYSEIVNGKREFYI